MDRKTENREREKDSRKRRTSKEQEPEELELEQEERQEGGWEDEPEGIPMQKGTMTAIFCGLVVLAAVICGILWHLTHGDRNDNGGESSAGGGNTLLAEEAQEPGMGDAAGEPQENGGDGSGATSGDGSGAAPNDGGDGSDAAPGDSVDSSGAAPGDSGAAPNDGGDSSDAAPGDGGDSSDAAPGDSGDGSNATSGVNESGSGSSVSTDPNRVSTLDGRVIVFTDCDDIVTPKIYVNLRSEPSTSEGESTVIEQISAGTWVHRTGISEDSGWSRIEKDGTVCYVVSSYIVLVGVDPE